MEYKKAKILLFFLLLLFGAACGFTVYLFYTQFFEMAIVSTVATIILLFFVLKRAMTAFWDLRDFSESIKYRDFTGAYSSLCEPYFREVKQLFLDMNIEKETQQQYLKKILEVVDTGILAYQLENNAIFTTNEALRRMLQIPQINNIGWLKNRNRKLYDDIISLKTDETKVLLVTIRNQVIKILVNASTFQTAEGSFKLIAFQNMNATFEEVEATAWKRLLSVMTHEIMNSIAPVSSLAETLQKKIEPLKNESEQFDFSNIEDIETGIETIKHRSDGLMQFAERYRNLYKPISLNVVEADVKKLFENVTRLMSLSMKKNKIEFKVLIEENLPMLEIDTSLIEQVLINLILNASEAVRGKEEPQIILSAGLTSEVKVYITVADNGVGIEPDMIDNIFIPFFSTKKTGSGIGLSLSRQIVKQHQANIHLQSKPNEGSAFTIVFR